MASASPKVLDVGQCDADHHMISAMIRREFRGAVDRAHTADEALHAVRSGGYDLVLVNRVFDHDGDEGLDLVRRIKSDAETREAVVMLVSNYPDAQAAASAAGAAPGFGKAALDAPETLALLKEHLGRA